MKGDSQLSRQRDLGLSRACSLRDTFCPFSQTRAAKLSAEDRVCRLVETLACEPVSTFRHPAVSADLAGLVSSWGEPEISAHARRTAEPGGIAEGRHDGHGSDRSNSRGCHQQTYCLMPLGNRLYLLVELSNAGQDVTSGLHKRLKDWNAFGRNGEFLLDDFLGAALEPTDPLAEHDPEGLQQTPDLILQPHTHTYQCVPRCKHCSVNAGAVAFDLHGVEPARAYDLGKTSSIVLVGLVGHHLEHAIGMARVDADDRYL